jgi:hypothetical protein
MRVRLGSSLLSLALHVLLLLMLQAEALPRLDLQPSPAIPVKILPARPVKPPPKPRSAPPPPQQEAKAPEPPKPEPPKPPEQKIPIPEQQIVSPPEAGEEKPPENTRFLSDRDTTVEKQMVKHGEPKRGEEGPPEKPAPEPKRVAENKPAAAPKPAPAPKPAADPRRAVEKRNKESVQIAGLPRLDQLLPSAVEIADAELERERQSGKVEEQKEAARRPRGSDVPFPATDVYGTLDFLPDIQSGHITLLNTKAELFAPFVRRVALRVFQNLLISLRRELQRLGVSSEEVVTLEAVMSPQGDLIGTHVSEHSPNLSIGTDRLLQQACLQGFFDRNPPRGAEAADGNIHFIIRTRVLAIAGPNQMQYGYRVAFQAGLL